jgi:hypothetical protein
MSVAWPAPRPAFVSVLNPAIPPLKRPAASKLEIPEIGINLPVQTYGRVKTVAVPFDGRMCNNGKFNTMGELMAFMAKHCVHHHGEFNRSLARLYLPYCKLLDLLQCEYHAVINLSRKEFETEYRLAFQSVSMDH